MSIIAYSETNAGAPGGFNAVTWAALATGDTGAPMAYSNLADKTVQVFGTTVTAVLIQGSNDPRVISDPTNAVWATLTDNLGNALSFAAAGLKLISEAPRYIRPSATTATAVTVIIASNVS